MSFGDDTLDPSKGQAPCRGSWLLGTACGKCRRCHETAAQSIATLQKELQRFRMLMAMVPPKREGYDYRNEFKAQYFDEIRRFLHEEDK